MHCGPSRDGLCFSIIGIVNVPVTATFPAAEPEIIPNKVLNITAVLALAACMFFVILVANLKKNSPAPNWLKKEPKIEKSIM